MEYEISRTCMLVNMGLTRSECASWVQAWGSIFAIVASVWIARNSYAKELSRRKEEEELNVQLSAIPVVSVLTGTASFLEKFLKFLPENADDYKRDNLILLDQNIHQIVLPLDNLIRPMGCVNLDVASSMSIAIEGVRQLKENLAHELMWPGPVRDNAKIAIFELLSLINFHVQLSSKSLREFLASRGVPLDRDV
ncbi:hypothetical protein N0K08_17565 [Acidovorax sp. Be4]|uniref:Uncharacterized protein n=1 Tax=Acidovorax bellezanensis TaxID=2976702 RepID=A0ABT2PPQ4_9BURK|nr:hypothetical protein [Acidovorax sp. Be4]MCT9812454.1 hypothetical protein [Acidovorax sp. Be4]